MSTDVRVWPGAPQPLGATWDGEGVNFALFSAHATAIDLCLFDDGDERESARVPLVERDQGVDPNCPGIPPPPSRGRLHGHRKRQRRPGGGGVGEGQAATMAGHAQTFRERTRVFKGSGRV